MRQDFPSATHRVTFWSIIECVGVDLGPGDGMNIFPVLFTTVSGRLTLVEYGSAECEG